MLPILAEKPDHQQNTSKWKQHSAPPNKKVFDMKEVLKKIFWKNNEQNNHGFNRSDRIKLLQEYVVVG